ncbi:TetR/AcrR family transcriptional regulator [Streptomyces sp. NPDC047061]|uniref:TetR/AcrR family transcriptional regulator n=1 Tax=Streptomyces sp. NPDC047061 TaxID=3154605 RepID=UPI00340FEA79
MAHVPADERRIQLIQAASRVISRQGVNGATTRAITTEAGAPQAILHYAFGTKDALFAELLRWSTTITDEIFDEERIPTGSGLLKAVNELLDGYRNVDRSLTFAQFDILLWSMRNQDTENEAADLYERLISQISSSLERAARENERDADFRYLAKLILIICDGVQFGMLCAGESYVDAEDITGIAKMIMTLSQTRAPLPSGHGG